MISGKPLTHIPYDEIEIGTEVVSILTQVKGKITSKTDKKHGEDDNWIVVKWENGNESHQFHYVYEMVVIPND